MTSTSSSRRGPFTTAQRMTGQSARPPPTGTSALAGTTPSRQVHHNDAFLAEMERLTAEMEPHRVPPARAAATTTRARGPNAAQSAYVRRIGASADAFRRRTSAAAPVATATTTTTTATTSRTDAARPVTWVAEPEALDSIHAASPTHSATPNDESQYNQDVADEAHHTPEASRQSPIPVSDLARLALASDTSSEPITSAHTTPDLSAIDDDMPHEEEEGEQRVATPSEATPSPHSSERRTAKSVNATAPPKTLQRINIGSTGAYLVAETVDDAFTVAQRENYRLWFAI